MRTTIRALVRRRFEVHPEGFDRHMQPWLARVYLNGHPQYARTAVCGSQPEAMQAAYKMFAELDAELMAEVHESRSRRRPERCGGCRDLGPHNYGPGCDYDAEPVPAHAHASLITTTEASA